MSELIIKLKDLFKWTQISINKNCERGLYATYQTDNVMDEETRKRLNVEKSRLVVELNALVTLEHGIIDAIKIIETERKAND